MRIDVQLAARQEQKLLLLPQMLQAIEILQLSTYELVGMVEQELASNETLELSPPAETASQPEPAEPPDDFDEEAPPRASQARSDESFDPMTLVEAPGLGLQGSLLAQLALLDIEEAVRETLSFLIGCLDENGHLLFDEGELAAILPGQDVDLALELLWSLEPAGLGRSGPLASMLAQIDPEDPDADLLKALVSEHLEDLAKNRWPKVARALGLEIAELRSLLPKLRHLEPCPGRIFTEEAAAALQADVVVRREDGEWQIYVDDARVPPLRVVPDYEALVQDRSQGSELRQYLRDKIGSARELMRAIEQRRDTLGRVARAMLERQRGFLERGPAKLVPLKMQEVADAVGVHLSTVSRAIAGKNVQTDFGIFPLRRLFDGGRKLGGSDRESLGRASVQERVRQVVDAEDRAAPLSDEAIASILVKEGFDVARRTIAKYRRELKIPSSWRRREY
ncbi:MAG: RNA polymerase sigma-54 factor [Planctomycetota bacterium]|nr:MAG: RNA polymerase sigma-54 factor [Planctomycetota bacterium]